MGKSSRCSSSSLYFVIVLVAVTFLLFFIEWFSFVFVLTKTDRFVSIHNQIHISTRVFRSCLCVLYAILLFCQSCLVDFAVFFRVFFFVFLFGLLFVYECRIRAFQYAIRLQCSPFFVAFFVYLLCSIESLYFFFFCYLLYQNGS